MSSSENVGQVAQRIRWLPGVLAVDSTHNELEIVFRGPSEGLLRRIHEALANGRA